jgi:Domain of unknown function (DUF4340)
LLIILLLVAAAYLIIKNRTASTTAQSTPTMVGNNYLVTQADGTLQVLHIIDSQNQIFQMQRDTSGTWVITQPTSGTADQALANAAETQVGALRIVTTLDNQLSLADAGLQPPSYTIELTFSSSLKHVIQVGLVTPTSSGYYVRFDSGNLYVVSQAGIDALLNLLKAPPFPATTTPYPTNEATVTQTLNLTTPTSTLEVATPTP